VDFSLSAEQRALREAGPDAEPLPVPEVIESDFGAWH